MLRCFAGAIGGLVYWLILTGSSWFHSGGGHAGLGWKGPGLMILPSLILLPITGILVASPQPDIRQAEQGRATGARIIAVILFVLDAILVMAAIHAISQGNGLGGEILLVVGFGLLWVGLWVVWHVAVIRIALE